MTFHLDLDTAAGLEPTHLTKGTHLWVLYLGFGCSTLRAIPWNGANYQKQSLTIFTLSPRNDPQRSTFAQYLW